MRDSDSQGTGSTYHRRVLGFAVGATHVGCLPVAAAAVRVTIAVVNLGGRERGGLKVNFAT